MRLRPHLPTRVLGSTFARMIAGYVLVAVVLAGAWVYSLSGPLMDAVISQQERNLRSVAQSAALLVNESDDDPQQVAGQLVVRTELRLTIVGADGTVIADSDFDPAKMENHAGRPEVREALGGSVGTARRTSATEGYEQLYVAVPGSLQGERVAVRVSQSLEDVRAIANGLRRFGLLMLAAALGLAVVVAWRATRSAAQPLRDLADVSEQMASGDLSARVPAVPSDLQGLADSLTSLRDQVRSRIDALDTERQTLQSALDGLLEAVLVLDGDTIATANTAAAQLPTSGQPVQAGGRLVDLGLPESLKAAIGAEVAAPTPGGVELAPDPTGRVWRVTVSPLPGTDEGRSVVVITDATERSRLDKMRREFVANASHELKTPVSGIKLLAESAQMASSDGDAEAAALFAGQILGEVERLGQLVADLLDLSRLEALPATDAMTDVRVAVDRALAAHQPAAGRKALDLRADFSAVEGRDVFVATDATDVAIALDNLLANAVAYTEQGSVSVIVGATDAEVRIAVTDTGTGIAAEHLARIFERFYRVDEARSRVTGGTGLGLALVRNVAERNGGSVSVSSELGRGSEFVLTLPRRR